MQYKNNKIDAALLGKIVLARFLELPLQGFARFVTQIESSAGFSALAPWVNATRLKGTQFLTESGNVPPHCPGSILGGVRNRGGETAFVYRREAFVREYLFDEAGIDELRSRQALPPETAGVLHRLRLINTRNRLTHALMEVVLVSQAAYLRCGDALALRPLTQAAVSARLRTASTLAAVADAGRVSRLVRGLSITLPDGKAVPLGLLFPKPRQVHCRFVKHVIQKEKLRLAQGLPVEPMTDEAIAGLLEREYGMRLLRRTVADIRHQLAIPDWRSRRQRMNYLMATEGFSALVPLTPQALRTVVPAHPGVYEIRAVAASTLGGQDGAGEGAPSVPHGVVYIGSSGDLRKRLSDHLRGSSGNACLSCRIDEGAVRVRFREVSDDWRRVERELYRVFCETFGTPPPCNRMSP